ncbi:MAG: LptF/LptG family permease [Gemmatimonadetes bacterium]|nr:LptF/LptG family permease [Gemmatimonadota bacterium]
MRLVRPLDRYVFGEWVRIFFATAIGFPLVLIIIDLTDHLDGYLGRQLPKADIALSYLYWIPDSMFNVLPAAVLFATVFSIGALTRHSEITAAKASGISFYRLILPVFLGSVGAMGLALVVGEIAPPANGRRMELLQESKFRAGRSERSNFAFAAEEGRVYKVALLNATAGQMNALEIERKGTGPAFPTYVLTAQAAAWQGDSAGWTLQQGRLHLITGPGADLAFSYDSLHDHMFRERPLDLLAMPRSPEEMRYTELGRFIRALDRSGGDASDLIVARQLKLAIPVTCVIIVLFGAPLATSTQRGGTAYGIGVSLATTILFLVMIQMTRAVGSKAVVQPVLAAWIPNLLFAASGLLFFRRVRT